MCLRRTTTFPHAVDKKFRRRRHGSLVRGVKNLEGRTGTFEVERAFGCLSTAVLGQNRSSVVQNRIGSSETRTQPALDSFPGRRIFPEIDGALRQLGEGTGRGEFLNVSPITICPFSTGQLEPQELIATRH